MDNVHKILEALSLTSGIVGQVDMIIHWQAWANNDIRIRYDVSHDRRTWLVTVYQRFGECREVRLDTAELLSILAKVASGTEWGVAVHDELVRCQME